MMDVRLRIGNIDHEIAFGAATTEQHAARRRIGKRTVADLAEFVVTLADMGVASAARAFMANGWQAEVGRRRGVEDVVGLGGGEREVRVVARK